MRSIEKSVGESGLSCLKMISDADFPRGYHDGHCPFNKSLQSLDASALLLANPLIRHGIQDEGSRRVSTDLCGGLDNVAFDLEGLEKIEPGSRKPLVGVHVRTVSAEEFVRSTLNSQSSRSKRSADRSFRIDDDLPLETKCGSLKHDAEQSHKSDGVCLPCPETEKTHIFCRSQSDNANGKNEYKSQSLKLNRESVFSTYRNEALVAKVKNTINKNLYDEKCGYYERKAAPTLISNSTKDPREDSQALNIVCNKSLPLKSEKKTDSRRSKKTENGSAALAGHEEKYQTSSPKTMVEVGGVSNGIPPPFSQNVNVVPPSKVVISSVALKGSTSDNRQVSVMNSVANTKVSNVVLNGSVVSSPTTSSTFASSVVSALSKVSSVRIVPSPNNTPTPSVVGVGTAASSTACPEDVPNRLSVAATHGKKSSQPYHAFNVVKRHLNNLKNGSEPTTSPAPTPEDHRVQQEDHSQQQPKPDGSPTTIVSNYNQSTQGTTQQQETRQSPPQADPLRSNTGDPSSSGAGTSGAPENSRREGRERRRERRERRRERRALRVSGGPGAPSLQTDLAPPDHAPRPHLPDLLNSHIPPPYSTLPNGGGPRNLGGLLGPPPPPPPPPPPHPPPPISLQMPPPPLAPLGGPFPPPHGSPIRPPIPADTPWHFFGSRRSGGGGRGSRRGHASYLGEEEAKSCCGLLVTQAVSIRWFIIMISFVGLCCTVVGTVLGAVKTNSSEYVTITLLMIGVGIVLITVSGVAWHLTSRDAPCRVMLGLSPNDSGRGEARRFMSRMAPTFGRPHHPYAAMMYPEFQYRPPPPSYQASMQEYRLRLFLLDRHGNNSQQFPGANNLPSPPPIYRSGPYNIRGMGAGTLSRESDYSRPPSYRSREGSVTHHPDVPSSVDPGGGVGVMTPVHSRDPSCLSFLSHEGSTRLRGNTQKGPPPNPPTKFPVMENSQSDHSSPPSSSSKKGEGTLTKDDNTVTIVQTTDSSHVIGSDSVIVTVSGNDSSNHMPAINSTEISVLAHL